MDWFDKILAEKDIKNVSEKNKSRIKHLAGDIFHAEWKFTQNHIDFQRENISRHIQTRTGKARQLHNEGLSKEAKKENWKIAVVVFFCVLVFLCFGLVVSNI